MKSVITSNPNRPAIIELYDLLFVPSSIIRLTNTWSSEGAFQPREKYRDSEFAQKVMKVAPYAAAAMWEGARLYGYYKLAEALF